MILSNLPFLHTQLTLMVLPAGNEKDPSCSQSSEQPAEWKAFGPGDWETRASNQAGSSWQAASECSSDNGMIMELVPGLYLNC